MGSKKSRYRGDLKSILKLQYPVMAIKFVFFLHAVDTYHTYG